MCKLYHLKLFGNIMTSFCSTFSVFKNYTTMFYKTTMIMKKNPTSKENISLEIVNCDTTVKVVNCSLLKKELLCKLIT